MAIVTSILTAGANSHETTSEEANGVYTDFIYRGVVGVLTNTSGVAPTTGGLSINAQGTPDMTVAVGSGVVYVIGTPTSQNSQTFRVKNSASSNVTISANSSGSTKYDWLYMKVDATKLATPNAAADDVATLVTSRSSSATTDDGTPPTYGTLLAVITVSNGASSITNGNIADKRLRAAPVGGINDVNGNEVVKTSATSSAVNEITVTNAATGNAPAISATGGDTNIDLNLVSKGTGVIKFNGVGSWTSFTPSWTNLTPGSGTNEGYYIKVGTTIFLRTRFVFGSGSSVGSTPTLTLPVTASSNAYGAASSIAGLVKINDSGGSVYIGSARIATNTTITIFVLGAGGTYVNEAAISSTAPMTWTTNDELTTLLIYEAA